MKMIGMIWTTRPDEEVEALELRSWIVRRQPKPSPNLKMEITTLRRLEKNGGGGAAAWQG